MRVFREYKGIITYAAVVAVLVGGGFLISINYGEFHQMFARISLSAVLTRTIEYAGKDMEAPGRDALLPPDPVFFRTPDREHPHGLTLVFFADQYASWEEFEHDIAVLFTEMRKVEPWKSYQTYNIYEVKPEAGAGLCAVKIENERKPALRCGAEINRYLNQLALERFKLIVLSRQDFQSWANVVRLQNSGIFFSLPKPISETDQRPMGILFLHLLGHAFGLKDEELIVLARADTAVLRPDGPNCAPNAATAEDWWGDLARTLPDVGYFKGCSGSPNYIKPTESSLMNLNSNIEKFVPRYGPVSERYLEKILRYCFRREEISSVGDKKFFEQYPEFLACAR